MEILLGTVCVCLLVILSIILWKYISLKKNIRHFSQELEKLKNSDYRQPVKVTDFDRDLVELAVKVNEHTDIQRQLGVEYEERKKQLGTVISGISHDFRTPLTASLGYLQMVEKSGELSEKNTEYLALTDDISFDINKVFDPFYQMDTRTAGGSGLGLYIVKLLCDKLGWTANAQVDSNNFLIEILI